MKCKECGAVIRKEEEPKEDKVVKVSEEAMEAIDKVKKDWDKYKKEEK